jgi:hypothetical protein
MADFVCDESGFACSDFGGTLGKGICGIGSTGCPSDNCFCDSSYWGFSTKKTGGWQFSFNDGMSSIPIKDGMVLGFRWSSNWGEVPNSSLKFCDICECVGGGKHVHIPKIMGMAILPAEPNPDEPVVIQLKDNKTGWPISGASITIYSGEVGVTPPLLSVESDSSGDVEFILNKTGKFTVEISGTEYPHEYVIIDVTPATTSTTTSTTETTTTSTTTTTYKMPEHFIIKDSTTTTVEPTTTTLDLPAFTGAAAATPVEPPNEGGLLGGLMTWISELIG